MIDGAQLDLFARSHRVFFVEELAMDDPRFIAEYSISLAGCFDGVRPDQLMPGLVRTLPGHLRHLLAVNGWYDFVKVRPAGWPPVAGVRS